MSSKNVELADAIVEKLNDGTTTFEFAFEAVRREAPYSSKELEDLSEVVVSVFTGSVKAERVTRRRYSKTYKPAVVIQRYLNGGTEEANQALVAQLHTLAEQIETVLEPEDFADLSIVGFNEEQDRPPYNLEMLMDNNVFHVAIVPEYTSG
jgi:hypothetical protein